MVGMGLPVVSTLARDQKAGAPPRWRVSRSRRGQATEVVRVFVGALDLRASAAQLAVVPSIANSPS